MAERHTLPEPDHYLTRTLEWAAQRSDLRQPTQDELQLLTEARAAHATFPAHLWEAYFSGASPRFPMQFEGTYAGLMANDPSVVEACEAAAAERDAFLARVSPGGDLRPLVEAIEADRAIAPPRPVFGRRRAARPSGSAVMAAISHKLHQSIGGLSYVTSQTITAASRASADPTGMDGYWVERALEQVAEHRRILDTLDAELRALASPAEAAA